jgi:hypothetical protein
MVKERDGKDLLEAMVEMRDVVALASSRAESWNTKALHIPGTKRAFAVYKEDGSIMAVMAVLTQKAPYQYGFVKEALVEATYLNVPLAIVAGSDPAVNIPREKLWTALDSWRPYVGPDGLTLDFARNAPLAEDSP